MIDIQTGSLQSSWGVVPGDPGIINRLPWNMSIKFLPSSKGILGYLSLSSLAEKMMPTGQWLSDDPWMS